MHFRDLSRRAKIMLMVIVLGAITALGIVYNRTTYSPPPGHIVDEDYPSTSSR
jgi:hypothetical protein